MNPKQAAQVIEALKQVDALIKHQFTGSHEAMNALQHACDAAHSAIAIMRAEIAKPEPEAVAHVVETLGFPIIEWVGEAFPVGTKLYATPAPAVPQWQPIETAPKDAVITLRVPTRFGKRATTLESSGYWIGFWVIFNADEAVQRVEPTHWREPLAAPSPTTREG